MDFFLIKVFIVCVVVFVAVDLVYAIVRLAKESSKRRRKMFEVDQRLRESENLTFIPRTMDRKSSDE